VKDLEKENLRLRRAISDLTLDKLILQEAAQRRKTRLLPRKQPWHIPTPGSLAGAGF
jgi:hypothetical protein